MRIFILLGLLAAVSAGPLSAVPHADGRIVGGTSTSIAKYPYQISVLTNDTHACGGSIISDKWVLTAAHCIGRDWIYTVRASSSIRDSGGEVFSVEKIVIHSGYQDWSNDYDIALLQISGTFNLGNNQEIIRLIDENEDVPVGTPSVLTGWGSTMYGGSYSTVLQEVTLPVLPQDTCKDAYGSMVTGNMFCAGYLEGGRDACQGDSGGPLVAEGKQIGIVSWGTGCAFCGYPGVYTRISTLRNWIKEKVGV